MSLGLGHESCGVTVLGKLKWNMHAYRVHTQHVHTNIHIYLWI